MIFPPNDSHNLMSVEILRHLEEKNRKREREKADCCRKASFYASKICLSSSMEPS